MKTKWNIKNVWNVNIKVDRYFLFLAVGVMVNLCHWPVENVDTIVIKKVLWFVINLSGINRVLQKYCATSKGAMHGGQRYSGIYKHDHKSYNNIARWSL